MLSKLFIKLFVIASVSISINAQNNVTLRRSFIDSLKNSISISGTFIVDHAHKRANAPKNDGDMHIAGRNKQVGLPIVAEIMNAADYESAVTLIHNVEGTNTGVEMTGVWRFWFEHPAKEQFQEDNLPKMLNTNPAHSFEIHPILSVNNIDLISSLTLIDGYKPYAAETAFPYYLNTKCKINGDNNYILIDTKMNRYNYVKFKIVITGKKQIVDDGVFVKADVYGTKKSKIAENIRMTFPKGSDAEKQLRTLKEGDIMHLLGIPRINLNEIVSLVNENPEKTEVKSSLPFEMIIVGVYE